MQDLEQIILRYTGVIASGFPKALNLERHIRKRYASCLENINVQIVEVSALCIQEEVKKGPTGGICRTCWRLWNKEHNAKSFTQTGRSSEGIQIPERQFKSGMEGWSLLQKQEGQVWTCQICKVPIGILF